MLKYFAAQPEFRCEPSSRKSHLGPDHQRRFQIRTTIACKRDGAAGLQGFLYNGSLRDSELLGEEW
jgi:hypothetical protein